MPLGQLCFNEVMNVLAQLMGSALGTSVFLSFHLCFDLSHIDESKMMSLLC